MNSIIEAQFDFFHDRRISEPEKSLFLSSSSLHFFGSDSVRKQLPDKAPVDKMYVYELPDIVITYADEVYRICKELPEKEAKEQIEYLDPEDYPIYIKQVNPYSAVHEIKYEPSKRDIEFLKYLSEIGNTDIKNTTYIWNEEPFIKTGPNE